MSTVKPPRRPRANRSPTVIDDDALAVWADFLRFHATVIDVLERDLVTRSGLALAWFDVLVQLDAAPDGRLRMQELAAAVVLSKSGLTRLIDRLERAGYVARTSCPSDRRGTYAEITPAGREALRRARPIHLQGVADHFAAHLGAGDMAAMGTALRALLTAHRQSPPGGRSPCGGGAASEGEVDGRASGPTRAAITRSAAPPMAVR